MPLVSDDLTELVPRPIRPEVATRAVRHLLRRGVVLLAAGLFGLVATVVMAIVLNARADALRTGGGQTPGLVVETTPGFWAFEGWISLRYTVDGVERVGQVTLADPVSRYHVGDVVTVYYDPDDPERIRTPDDDNSPLWTMILITICFLAAVILLPVGVGATLRWWGRARTVYEPGWRAGQARVVKTQWECSLLDITLDEEPTPETIQVHTTLPVAFAVPKDLVDSGVLLGGAGTRLVIAFHVGPFLVAAKPRHGAARKALTQHCRPSSKVAGFRKFFVS